MFLSRRIFLGAGFGMAAASVLGAAPQGGPPQGPPGTGPGQGADGNGRFGDPMDSATHFPPRDNRRILKANQDEIRKDVARLSDLVEELKKELGDNDTKEVLSLDVVHKTDEIDKLTKQIKSLVVG